MMLEMRKAFDEAIEKFENVETYILIVADEKMQMNAFQGKCKKALREAMAESPEVMEVVENALENAKIQIKINELLAEAKKYGVPIPEMDDETEAEEKE
ncbi:MAG: hypothetical protein J6U45_05645 [Alistipes sp.]|nr:hypothetical protein [Alistipes sp.]